jgi:hypothetical protein
MTTIILTVKNIFRANCMSALVLSQGLACTISVNPQNVLFSGQRVGNGHRVSAINVGRFCQSAVFLEVDTEP